MSMKRGAQPIGEILRDFIEAKGLGNKLKHLEVYGAWEEVVGPGILPHTRVAGFAHQKLYVDVDSAAHLHELRSFHKPQILRELQARVPGIRILDVVFRPAASNRS